MKLKTAIDIIRNREKHKREEQREIETEGLIRTRKLSIAKKNQKFVLKTFVYVQTVLSEEDIIALKTITKERYLRNALMKAIYFYLEHDFKEEK